MRGRVQRARLRAQRPVTLGARVVPTDGDGQVLLVRHTYGDGKWYLPGGGVRTNESFSTAALRELREKTGLTAQELTLAGLFTNHAEGRTGHIAIFVAIVDPRAPLTASNETAECRWFSLNRLPDLTPGTARRLSEFAAGNKVTFGSW